VNEIADAPAGAAQSASIRSSTPASSASTTSVNSSKAARQEPEQVTMTYAVVGKDGKVKFEESS